MFCIPTRVCLLGLRRFFDSRGRLPDGREPRPGTRGGLRGTVREVPNARWAAWGVQ